MRAADGGGTAYRDAPRAMSIATRRGLADLLLEFRFPEVRDSRPTTTLGAAPRRATHARRAQIRSEEQVPSTSDEIPEPIIIASLGRDLVVMRMIIGRSPTHLNSSRTTECPSACRQLAQESANCLRADNSDQHSEGRGVDHERELHHSRNTGIHSQVDRDVGHFAITRPRGACASGRVRQTSGSPENSHEIFQNVPGHSSRLLGPPAFHRDHGVGGPYNRGCSSQCLDDGQESRQVAE
jgi:hypothetical protein